MLQFHALDKHQAWIPAHRQHVVCRPKELDPLPRVPDQQLGASAEAPAASPSPWHVELIEVLDQQPKAPAEAMDQ
jgi:hypothetical protein